MKSAIKLLTIFVVVGLLVFPKPVSAQGPTGDWVSSIFCQNQDQSNAASITLTFYDEETGTVALTYSDTIAAGGTKNYYTPSSPPGLPTNFLGSAVVSSSTPLSCTVQVNSTATGTSGSPYRYGYSGGFSSTDAAPTMYVPGISKAFGDSNVGFYNSYIAIQNTSSAAVAVTIDYTDRWGNAVGAAQQNINIPSMATDVIYLENNAGLPNGYFGSAVVSADDGTSPLAVQFAVYNDGTASRKAQFTMWNGVSGGSDTVLMPSIVSEFYDFKSGLTVQNVGTTNTSFKITFSMGRGATQTQFVYQHPTTLAPGENYGIFVPNLSVLDPLDSWTHSDRFGSAIVEATDVSGNHNASGEIIVAGSSRNDGGYAPNTEWGGISQGSMGMALGNEASTSFLPNFPKIGGGFVGGLIIVNATGTAGTCDIDFVDDADAFMDDVALSANGQIAFNANYPPNLDLGYDSGVYISCTVDVFVQGNVRSDGTYGDSAAEYLGGTP